jgi:hypothetical protein
MFSVNGVETLLAILWVTGIASALTAIARGLHGVRGWATIAIAVFVPVVGSFFAIAVLAAHVCKALRSDPQLS